MCSKTGGGREFKFYSYEKGGQKKFQGHNFFIL